MPHEVVFSPQARTDQRNLYLYIAEKSGDRIALAYTERVEAFCERFSTFPERGQRRGDLSPGLRVVGFEKRLSIVFHVEPDRVVIDRVLYGGRDLSGLFDSD